MRRHDPNTLTPREREVLGLLRCGLTNEEIAQRLSISLDGAKYHVSQILSKLGVATREEAAAVALGERRRWWATWPLWARIGSAATVAAAIAGLAVLVWGVIRSNEEADVTGPLESVAADRPNGGILKIVFAGGTHIGSPDSDVYTVNSDGSGLMNISDDISDEFATQESMPSLSPDGNRIAYFSLEREKVSHSPTDPKGATSNQIWYLYVANTDGTGRHRLSQWFQSHSNIPPVWSPDSARIAFESEREEGDSEIFVINTDGSGLVNVSDHPAFDDGPTWSPNGEYIAFTSNRDGRGDVYVAAIDGSETSRLTTAGGHSPAWSPDGSRIAFLSQRDGNSELYVMNSDGSGTVNLSSHPAQDFSGAPVGHSPPVWAGDSKRIAFLSDRDGRTKVYIANTGGSAATRLTNIETFSELLPSWSPDDAGLIFFADGSIYTMRAGGEEAPQLIVDTTELPSSAP